MLIRSTIRSSVSRIQEVMRYASMVYAGMHACIPALSLSHIFSFSHTSQQNAADDMIWQQQPAPHTTTHTTQQQQQTAAAEKKKKRQQQNNCCCRSSDASAETDDGSLCWKWRLRKILASHVTKEIFEADNNNLVLFS